MASQPARYRSAHTPRGFTLIEVLVVVGIIGLLVALLLPSLQQVRSQAQGAKCASNMKQGVNGALMHLLETGMRKERWSTNFGWATQALRKNRQETAIFTCPSDPSPLPVPAVLDRQYDGVRFRGESAGDAIFNRVVKVFGKSSTYITDIQDTVDETSFGGDAYADTAGDCMIEYEVTPGQTSASAFAEKGFATWRHDIYTYKGSLLWSDVNGKTPSRTLPIMWMSFGANANAGLKNTKGPVLLIAEAGKLGLFPEDLGGYPADNLARAMRFRHGGRVGNPGMRGADYLNRFLSVPPPATGSLGGAVDRTYTPRQRANAGFMDGHVSLMSYTEFFTLHPTSPEYAMPVPKGQVWFGLRRTMDNKSF